MKHVWLWWNKGDLKTERQQLIEEGYDIRPLEPEFERLLADDMPEDTKIFQSSVDEILDQGRNLPTRANYPYLEPSDLNSIQAQRANGPREIANNHSEATRRDHIAGAWLGRCAGCLLGKPIEGVHSPKLKLLMDRAACTAIPDYLWRLPGLSDGDYEELGFGNLLWYKTIDSMPVDDDTNYTVMGMALLKKHGINFTPSDMADFWMDNVPILRTCTAERVAYRNFTANIEPPESAAIRNPYREWIGAQIRADVFGYVAIGRPQLAAELAWRDASISHVKNGIYGAMWVAAMLSVAMLHTDPRNIIEIGLSEIPQKSRFFEAITKIVDQFDTGASYSDALQFIHQSWQETSPHHWCHTISNAQIVALGLLYSEGDYEKAITRTVLACFDTDCNGATVGSIMGMMLGANALPAKWTQVMNDTINTDLTGYQVVPISKIAEEIFQLQNNYAKSLNS